MRKNKKHLGDEIFAMFAKYEKKRKQQIVSVCQRLARDEEVTDGELLDALFSLTSSLDLGSPLLPITTEIIERYMRKIGMKETPNGMNVDWFNDEILNAEEIEG